MLEVLGARFEWTIDLSNDQELRLGLSRYAVPLVEIAHLDGACSVGEYSIAVNGTEVRKGRTFS